MKNLVVVESPTKAKTIGKFLGKDYEIVASMGHIMDLPKSKLSIDIEKDFKPDYQVVEDKKKTISALKSAGKNAENIILATDPDREGEAIASHVQEILKTSKNSKNFKRIVFHEITKEAIDEAFKNPRSVDANLVDAQTARRVLDRLVGYKLSPILWQKVRRGLSAGRVQSVALRLIVERERKIEAFKKEKYYTIEAIFTKDGKEVEFELIEIDGKKIEVKISFTLYAGEYTVSKTTIESEAEAKKITEVLKTGKFTVSDVSKKQAKRSPGPSFTTSTLQQEASRRFGYSGKRTMNLAQKLYEEGYITYHRTDSVYVAPSAVSSTRSYIEKNFGKNYIPETPRFYKTKQKLAQEAHEAIRPTKVEVDHNKVTENLGKDYSKIYNLIWNRAVSSQMSDAIIEQTAVIIDSQDKKYRFKTNGSVLVFDGFLKVNPFGISEKVVPDFSAGETLTADKISYTEHETMPPPRYNDASLIAMLEEKGIGRPSTYASIISTLEQRQYVERLEGRFHPTNVGFAVNDFLVANFATVDDIPFTAQMEDELDEIATGKIKWVPVINEFYVPFEKTLENVKDAARVKIETEKTGEKCPTCKTGDVVIRTGRFGKFLSCSTFPVCKYTAPFVQETNLICPKDGGKIILKKTRKGRRFYGCSNYPKCDFAAWKLDDIKNPKEKGESDKEQEASGKLEVSSDKN